MIYERSIVTTGECGIENQPQFPPVPVNLSFNRWGRGEILLDQDAWWPRPKTQIESSGEMSNHCKLCWNLWKSSQDPFGMEIYLFPWFINSHWPVISCRQQPITRRNVKMPDSPGTDWLRFLVPYRGWRNITLGETDCWRRQYCLSDVRQ